MKIYGYGSEGYYEQQVQLAILKENLLREATAARLAKGEIKPDELALYGEVLAQAESSITYAIVIKHWKIHNLIQKDRYKETTYLEEKSMLTLDRKNAYIEKADTDCIQAVSEMDTQYRLGKGSAEQSSAEKGRVGEKGCAEGGTSPPKRFEKPTVEEIAAYCEERQNGIDPQQFFDFYESKGWKVGREPMKDWRACVRTWEKREGGKPAKPAPNSKYNRED